MIEFYFKNQITLGKRLTAVELIKRWKANNNKLLLWGYFTTSQGKLCRLEKPHVVGVFSEELHIFSFVKEDLTKKFDRFIAFTSKERAMRLYEQLPDPGRDNYMDLSHFFTEVYD